MKRILKYILIVTCLSISKIGYAQDQVVFNNYISNQGILNPAYNGTRDVISGLAIFRSQWTGFTGAPMIGGLNAHGPIDAVKNLGAGVVFLYDKVGFTNQLEFYAAGSYKLKIDRQNTLSLGLQMGFKNVVYDGANAFIIDYGDPLFTSKISKFGFNFGFGGYLYAENYFAGISIPRFFTNKYDTNKQEIKNTVVMADLHMYLYGGYLFMVDDIRLKPTGLLRIVPGSPLELDLSINAMFVDQLWLGISYRTVSDLVFMAEYQINRNFAVKYSFDYPFSSIGKYAKFGSHELAIQYDFSPKRRPGMRSIRYF